MKTSIFNYLSKVKRTKTILISSSVACVIGSIGMANASSLLVDVQDYYYEIPKNLEKNCYETDTCPDIDIAYLHTQKTWMNDIINSQINDYIIGSEGKRKGVTFNDEDGDIRIPNAVKDSLKSFVQEWSESQVGFYELSSKPTYKGHAGSLELFEIASYTYSGGAHGVADLRYVVFDSKKNKQLKLSDVVISGKKTTFDALLHDEFSKWVESEMEMNVKDYEGQWAFHVSDNFTFTEDGISILYQPYEISAYAFGMPEFTLPYNKLIGIVKAQYLSDGQSLAR